MSEIKLFLTIATICVVFFIFGFCTSQEFFERKYNIQYNKFIIATEKKYSKELKEIREKFKEAKEKLKEDYSKKLDTVETDCPKELIYFFDYDMLKKWYQELTLYGFIVIEKNALNSPMTHLTERDSEKLDDIFNEFLEKYNDSEEPPKNNVLWLN
jgi:hypothetical protein